MKEYLKSSEEVLKEQNTSLSGLSEVEANDRLEKNGKNKQAEIWLFLEAQSQKSGEKTDGKAKGDA